jgi:hypothetical protein
MVLAGSQEYVTTLLIRRFGQSWPEIPKIPPWRNAASKGSMERENRGRSRTPCPGEGMNLLF